MNPLSIPFNKPGVTGRELDYVSQAIRNGWISGDGEFTRRCHALLETTLGVPRVLLTTSCTDALEMAALLLELRPGDEVIVPSFTFVSTANAFALHGARIVFADIRPDTLNLDESKVEQLITPRTRAIVPVHYAGIGCEMDRLSELARNRGLSLIEDNAHGLFGRYRGRFLGTFGSLATLSFHETKNISCGEGGALILNDAEHVERAEILRAKGTNRSAFLRGQADKYTWVDLGSSFLPSDLLAAFLLAQLESAEAIRAKRERLWNVYHERLETWAALHEVKLPFVPPHCEQAFHMFYLLMPSLEQRQSLIEHLRRHGILSVFHYVPLHTSPMGLKHGGRPGGCPVTEMVSERLVRLPFFNDLSASELDQVVDAIHSWTPTVA
jgi:dTDP-4-amino-4,6-dideoxygalactose transaminase